MSRHPCGYWYKKVKSKLHYFGKLESDPQVPAHYTAEACLDAYLAPNAILALARQE